MTSVREAAESLEQALRDVEGLRVYRDLGGNIDPPAVVIGPPALGFGSFGGPAPTSARFLLYLVVAASEHASEQLWDLIPQVVAAVESLPDAVMAEGDNAAVPGTYPSAGVALPAYELTIEFAL